VANWTKSSSSDVIFVADFPGLFLENFLPTDLTNITLTVLSGRVIVEQKGEPNVTLISSDSSLLLFPSEPKISGKTIKATSTSIRSGNFHKIHVISQPPQPSSYMYTYTNRTLLEKEDESSSGQNDANNNNDNSFSPTSVFHEFISFLEEKAEIFSRSLYLVVNAHLNLLFDVPMVLRKSLSS
jgi:vitamin K-dependent gamma-carboxylase